MSTPPVQSDRRSAAAPRPSAARLAAMLDSASLPDMGDRSLDQETHAYLRPRRRRSGQLVKSVVRRAAFPIPEPRLPIVTEFARGKEPIGPSARLAQTLFSGFRAHDEVRAQWVSLVYPRGASREVLAACSGPIVASSPRAWESRIVMAPPFDAECVRRRVVKTTAPTAAAAAIEPDPVHPDPLRPEPARSAAPRFTSPEEQVARMAARSGASIAILAIGVEHGIVGQAKRFAEILESEYRCRVELAAAENGPGLRFASALTRPKAGDVRLFIYEATAPGRILPALAALDGVIAMVEIGETPVDAAAAWAQALRREQIPLIGVWAA